MSKEQRIISMSAVRTATGLVTVEKTRIVLNCPVIYTSVGGLLPKAVGAHTSLVRWEHSLYGIAEVAARRL